MATPSFRAPDRLRDLDALRGFALLGILMVNISSFASAYYVMAVADPLFARPVDHAVRWITTFLFETKFYLLFSFLFGYSFTLQMDAAERAGKAFAPRMLRRLLGLWLLGAAHAVWLYHGDILATYAMLGVLLLALRWQTEAQAVGLAGLLTLLPAIALMVFGGSQLLSGQVADIASTVARAAIAQSAWTGTPATAVAQRLEELSFLWIVVALVQGPCALAMFMLGHAAGRRGVFAQPDDHARLWQRLPLWGLCIGVPGAIFYATAMVYGHGSGLELVALGVSLLTAPFLSFTYVAIAMKLFRSAHGSRIAALLADAGRMALSNYLLQSLACALIFTAYGLGWMGRVSPGGCVLIALAIFALQLLASRWWLQQFRYGPVEWLLRALTLRAWPAMR